LWQVTKLKRKTTSKIWTLRHNYTTMSATVANNINILLKCQIHGKAKLLGCAFTFCYRASATSATRGQSNLAKAASNPPPPRCRGPGPLSNISGPQECSPQTGSWSVQPFLHSEVKLSHVTDRLTDRQTDTANIGNNSLHLMHSMQPKNIWASVTYQSFCSFLALVLTKIAINHPINHLAKFNHDNLLHSADNMVRHGNHQHILIVFLVVFLNTVSQKLYMTIKTTHFSLIAVSCHDW